MFTFSEAKQPMTIRHHDSDIKQRDAIAEVKHEATARDRNISSHCLK